MAPSARLWVPRMDKTTDLVGRSRHMMYGTSPVPNQKGFTTMLQAVSPATVNTRALLSDAVCFQLIMHTDRLGVVI